MKYLTQKVERKTKIEQKTSETTLKLYIMYNTSLLSFFFFLVIFQTSNKNQLFDIFTISFYFSSLLRFLLIKHQEQFVQSSSSSAQCTLGYTFYIFYRLVSVVLASAAILKTMYMCIAKSFLFIENILRIMSYSEGKTKEKRGKDIKLRHIINTIL